MKSEGTGTEPFPAATYAPLATHAESAGQSQGSTSAYASAHSWASLRPISWKPGHGPSPSRHQISSQPTLSGAPASWCSLSTVSSPASAASIQAPTSRPAL
ncbi:hypothetical protein H639_08674 [Cutibacterium avidum TM16]|nr:hypothetical protein H639_08674 [Cutibacterium avidum TM16]